MQIRKKILEFLSKEGLAYSGLNNLFSFISKTYNFSIGDVKKEFEKLEKEGLVFEIRKGKFITIPSHGYVKGKFIGNAKGFGFVEVDGAENSPDIFIPANLTFAAIDGDKVIVKVCQTAKAKLTAKLKRYTNRSTKLLALLSKWAKVCF